MRTTSRSVLLAGVMYLFVGCATVAPDPEAVAAARARAHEIWQRNMLIVDESVALWKGRSGTASFTSDELTTAIEFFETLTGIEGANFSFIGPIPDEGLEKLSAAWKVWHETHGQRLMYDTSKKRVILTD